MELLEVCDFIVDCPHSTAKDEGKGFPLVRTPNVGKSRLILDGVHRVSKEVYKQRIARAVPSEGDLILAREAPVGNVAIITKGQKVCLGQRVVLIRPNKEKAYPQFLVYYLLSPNIQHNLKNTANGAVVSHLNVADIRKVDIELPSLTVQKKIGDILSSLDSKIETNNKINAKLEEMAQALFKSWFVDFEPFKDGKFVESELGMIPEGWRVGKLGEICTFKRGKGLLSKNAIEGDVPVVAGGMSPSCYHNVANTQAPVVTVSGSGANAGFMRMYHVDVWASDCSFIDRNCPNLLFVYYYLSINSRLLRHAQTGAVQPHVKPSDIHDFDVVIPPEDAIRRFQQSVACITKKIGNNEAENLRLSQLRDTLLPKLMNGEIEI